MKLQVQSFIPYLRETQVSLRSICFTAGLTKSSLKQRLAVVASSKMELVQKLKAFLNGDKLLGVETGLVSDAPQKLGFVFTGQGPQWFAMGRELLQNNQTFRDAFEQIEQIFVGLAGWSLEEEMLKDEASSSVSTPCCPASHHGYSGGTGRNVEELWH